MAGDFKNKFFDITNLIQQEFDRNVDKYGNKIQCRRGCYQCCSQIFNITLIDASIIKEHVNGLTEKSQRILKDKARKYLEIRTESEDDVEFSVKPKIPCPALGGEGECTIYEARPVICRRFGIPIYDYKKPDKLYACELNFREGEEINDAQLIPAQTAIGKRWDALKEEYLASQADMKINHTTIAEAILSAT